MTPKPGVKTSEFWLTFAGLLVAGLVAARIVPAAQAATLTDNLGQMITALFALYTQANMIRHYVESRSEAKANALAMTPTVTPTLTPTIQARS